MGITLRGNLVGRAISPTACAGVLGSRRAAACPGNRGLEFPVLREMGHGPRHAKVRILRAGFTENPRRGRTPAGGVRFLMRPAECFQAKWVPVRVKKTRQN